jgi:phage terminase Nu1 subunit (DNA packaging protein)
MARKTTLDTTQLAKLLLLTNRHVRRLAADGVLVRARDEAGNELRGRYELVENIQAYIRYQREALRLDDASDSRGAQLRNQKLAAEAQIADIRLAVLRGEVHNAKDVEFVMTNMITYMKQHLLSIPSRTARLCVGVTSFQKIYDLLSREIEAVLRELTDYNPDMFAPQNAEYLAAIGADPAALTDSGSNGSDDDEGEDEDT